MIYVVRINEYHISKQLNFVMLPELKVPHVVALSKAVFIHLTVGRNYLTFWEICFLLILYICTSNR